MILDAEYTKIVQDLSQIDDLKCYDPEILAEKLSRISKIQEPSCWEHRFIKIKNSPSDDCLYSTDSAHLEWAGII